MTWVGVDPSEWGKDTAKKFDTLVQQVAIEVFVKIILRSPVDTGRFRANWQVSIGDVPEGTLLLEDKTGTATIARVHAEAMNLQAGDTITLTNNLPYAGKLEEGYSQQAPEGMVELTVQDFPDIVNRIANRMKS